jgi:threonine dehydrogenase-like Zn-dependent dehydrogenase
VRAVRQTEQGIEVQEVPKRDPGPGEVRVRVRSTSICGTDIHNRAAGPLPFTIGHEFAGLLDDGTAVAIESLWRCGTCPRCLTGHYNVCADMQSYGFGPDGGLADEVVVQAATVVPLPAGLAVADASIVEPMSVALHGLRIGGLRGGERVAVVGGGSIGLMAAVQARLLGCDVAVAARHPHQLEAAERLGVAREPVGEHDLVIDAAGSDSGLARCIEVGRPGARIVMLGVYFGHVPISGTAMLVKEQSLVASMAYARGVGGRDFDAAARTLADHPEIVEAVVTHRFPLTEAARAFEVAADRKSGSIKVILDPEDG